ncbi:hypothetical protein EPN52_01920 [bacterium]|nr:MAG: hypothetical protein EPN52_01920 [bacterium]
MVLSPALLLVAAAASVGVLHTAAPDHWAPIALLARQRGWSPAQTARAAAGAGLGHTLSTLAIGVVIWLASAAVAARFARSLNLAAGIALIAFGLWIALAALHELQEGHESHEHGHAHLGHSHLHRHADGVIHLHWHEHHAEDWHVVDGTAAIAHEHEHRTSTRMALMLILGSSPSVEVLPAFSAAAPQGAGLLAAMATVFGITTIGTYVALCALSSASIQRLRLGPLERYGEVLSGVVIALVGAVFLLLEGSI